MTLTRRDLVENLDSAAAPPVRTHRIGGAGVVRETLCLSLLTRRRDAIDHLSGSPGGFDQALAAAAVLPGGQGRLFDRFDPRGRAGTHRVGSQ